MGLHGRRAEVDAFSDLGSRVPGRHELQHLPLARGEHGTVLPTLALVELARESRLDLGRERCAAAGNRGDPVADLLPRRLLRQVSLRTRGYGAVGEVAVEVGGEQQDLRAGAVSADCAEHLEAVQPGHPDVEEGDVGLQLADGLERVATVAGLPHQLEVGALADRPHDAVPIDGMVVGHEYPHPIRSPRAQASSWITPVRTPSSSCRAQANPPPTKRRMPPRGRNHFVQRPKEVGAPRLGMDWRGAPGLIVWLAARYPAPAINQCGGRLHSSSSGTPRRAILRSEGFEDDPGTLRSVEIAPP